MNVKRLIIGVAACAVILTGSGAVYAQRFDFPPPDDYVSDFADILSDATEEELEAKLEAFDEEESTQILVVTMDTLPENAFLDTFVPELTDDHPEWKAGTEELDNGVFFLIVVDDRDTRIHAGYGIEGALPDGKARMILDYEVQPGFMAGDYDEGVKAGVEAIMEEVTGEYIAEQAAGGTDEVAGGTDEERSGISGMLFICCPFFMIFFLPYLAAFLGRTKSWWLGGVIGFIGGLVLAGVGSALIQSLIGGIALFSVFPILMGALGLIFDFILSRNYKVRKSRGLSTGWTRSFGGFSSGGGFSGKGFGGGGGGGFRAGGGSFGGGGASSGW
jgi:uncharacterized protein